MRYSSLNYSSWAIAWRRCVPVGRPAQSALVVQKGTTAELYVIISWMPGLGLTKAEAELTEAEHWGAEQAFSRHYGAERVLLAAIPGTDWRGLKSSSQTALFSCLLKGIVGRMEGLDLKMRGQWLVNCGMLYLFLLLQNLYFFTKTFRHLGVILGVKVKNF